ncbi:MAG TPA: hypothetical protein VGB67_02420 [Fibrella sp.]|jgi:hypothetical protein
MNTTLKKRYQLFVYYIDSECGSEGGLYDIWGEADTLEEAQQQLLDRHTHPTLHDNNFYWLDMDERRESTDEEVAEFLASFEPLWEERYPPPPPRPPLTPEERERFMQGLWYQPANFNPLRLFASGLTAGLFNQMNNPPPDPKETERERFLKSCRVL